MARDFGPFPSKPMYEVVNRRMQKALAEATSSTGFAKTGQGAVTAGTGAQLVIAAYPDGALVDGLYVENPASETVTLTTNSNANPRIDRLVLRLDMAAETIAPFQIVGTPATSPTAPALVKTTTTYDMPLCQYRFPGSASAQNPGSIVDERVVVASGQGIELASSVGSLVVPPNTSSLTAFVAGDVVGQDQDGFLQAGQGHHLKIPAGLGGVYSIGWGGALTSTPLGRHFWDLLVTGSRTVARRANGYGDTNVTGFVEMRLAALDVVRFEIYVDGTGPSGGNWPIASRFLTCYRKSA